MIFSLIGSGLFLLGVIILYDITGHLLMPNLKESVAGLYETGAYRLPLLASMSLITVGIAIKSGLFPFHLWMADTYGAAVPASSGILLSHSVNENCSPYFGCTTKSPLKRYEAPVLHESILPTTGTRSPSDSRTATV